MPGSNRDNMESWKQRLDSFEAPGDTFSPDAAWDRLELRRTAVAAPKKSTSFYRVAAAVVALLGLAALFMKNSSIGTKATEGITIVPKANGRNAAEPTAIKSREQPSPVISNTIVVNTAPVKKTPAIIHAPVKESGTIADPVKQVPEELVQAPVLQQPDSVATFQRPAMAAVKKIKVVHINEINSNHKESALAQQEGRPYFPVSYQTRQVYTNSTEQSIKKEKNNLVRIKLFP
ncbi:MAG: hypothetical protein QM687_08990 [Ferruginibacter sp.]